MKKILILNGNPNKEGHIDQYGENLKVTLESKGNLVTMIQLKDKNIKDCIGCYSCWLKTPGICALEDDQEEILKLYIQSHFIVLLSPLIMGFISASLKKVQDRLLPLIHPFLKLDVDRMSHYPRYDKSHHIGLIIDKGQDFQDNDMEMVYEIYGNKSYASEFIKFTDENMEEIANEINNI